MGHFTETDYPGIDYGLGKSNIDEKTGIHFGVISMNAEGLSEWAWESMEADYGDPTCPKCGNGVRDHDEVMTEIDEGKHRDDYDLACQEDLELYHEHSCSDYICLDCGLVLGSDEVYGDEPCGHKLEEDGYEGFVDSSNDLMILKSPFYTNAQYCSPCAPGAGHLENPCPTGPKTYCLGHDWFQGGRAPYPVFSVETGQRVDTPEVANPAPPQE